MIGTGFSGDVYYAIIANAFIHLVMYMYYLVATVSTSPWWGKYLTQVLDFLFHSKH